MKEGQKVTIKQIRGRGGQLPALVRTLDALGLGRIGKHREVTLNAPINGMLRKVAHLIEVRPVGK